MDAIVCDYHKKDLPTIDLIAGDSEVFLFHTYFVQKPTTFDLSHCTAEFALVSHTNRNGTPYITKPVEIYDANTLRLELCAEDTLSLEGKYIYQITIQRVSGEAESYQGVMLITNNINKEFFRT